ncbi:MAG TPA: hypothetical protein VFQ72_02060 [Candidatus Paceibacterota bacterium]|nr:hypothetical protein [Candidatus Paceibacterota bacterium]
MFNISDYFKKFARLEGESLLQKEAIEQALKEVCGIPHAGYSLKKGVLTVKGSPMLKSVVFTKKQQLLAALQASLPQGRITDVR